MNTNKKKVVYESTTYTTNYETGEVTQDISNKVARLPLEPPYIKQYIDDLTLLLHVPKAQRDVLDMMLRKLDYEGIISLTPRYRQRMCEKLKIEDGTLRNRISALVKADILRNVSRGEYEANPNYFARGAWEDICRQRNMWKMEITYSKKDGRVIKTHFEEENPQEELFD